MKDETHAILESIPAGIGVLDSKGNVDTINGHLLQYYGSTLDELRHWGSSDVVHPDDLSGLMEAIRRAVSTRTAYEAEVRLRRTCLRVLATDAPNIDVAKDAARRMIRDANRAADVIARLWELFSRKPPHVEALDIDEIATEVIALISSDLQRSKVSLTTDFPDDRARVAGARVQLQQVIMNLLRNSIEALSTVEDRPRQILLKSEANGGEIWLYGRLWAKPNPGHGVRIGFSAPTSLADEQQSASMSVFETTEDK